MIPAISNTPWTRTLIGNRSVWVKHEEDCAPPGAPPFGKLRGVMAHISGRQETTIGCLDTVHSKGGWAVAWVCAQLGRKARIYYPRFVKDRGWQESQNRAAELGADICPLPAGRSCILYHQARRDMEMFPNS